MTRSAAPPNRPLIRNYEISSTNTFDAQNENPACKLMA